VDGAAIVVDGAAQGVELEEDGLAAGHRLVPTGGEPADAVPAWRGLKGVIDVHAVVGGEVRVKGDPKQPPLPDRVDDAGEVEERPGEENAVFDDDEATTLLGDEDAAVGSDVHRRWAGDASRHQRLGEASGKHRGVGREARPEGRYHHGKTGKLRPEQATNHCPLLFPRQWRTIRRIARELGPDGLRGVVGLKGVILSLRRRKCSSSKQE